MQRIVVALRRWDHGGETDFEVPTDVGAAELAERLAQAIGIPGGDGALELRAVSLGRALRPDETLADAGLWDGTTLILARSTDPVEAGPRTGSALAVADTATRLALIQAAAPPVLALPVPEEEPRSVLPFVVLGVLLIAVIGGGAFWFARSRESTPVVPAPSASAVVPQVTADLTPAASGPTSVPTPLAATKALPDEESAWRELLGSLDKVWGVDWPAAIGLLQAYHTQYPTRTAATDKLYAALVEYGRALHAAGASNAAAEVFDQAVRFQPQRIEARAELAAMTPPPTPVPEPVEAPPASSETVGAAARVSGSATGRPATAPIVVPPIASVEAAPEPAAAPCDVRSSDLACPLADGSLVEGTIDVPDGRHFYWFGVPTPAMALRVEASGPACPCALLVFSDQVDDANTPIATASSDAADSILLEQTMTDPGPYLLALIPSQDGSDPHASYALAFTLQPPPPPPTEVDEPPPPPPPPPPTATPVPAPVPVLVPPVVARSAGEAADRVRAAGLEPLLQTVDRVSPGGAGTIAAQDPQAGSSVPQGSGVTLLVASGDVVVPAVSGLAEQDAWTRLRDAGLDVVVRHARRSDVDAGRAASTDPPGGALVQAGTTVVLTVSQGR